MSMPSKDGYDRFTRRLMHPEPDASKVQETIVSKSAVNIIFLEYFLTPFVEGWVRLRVLYRVLERGGKRKERRAKRGKKILKTEPPNANVYAEMHGFSIISKGVTENAVGMDVVMTRRGFGKRETGHLLVVEEDADGFTVVDTTNGLGEDGGDIQDLEPGSQRNLVVGLGHRVGDDHLVDGRGLDAADGIATEDAMAQESVDGGSTFVLEKLGGPSDGVSGIQKIIHQDAHTVGHVSDEHHGGILTIGNLGRASFLDRG